MAGNNTTGGKGSAHNHKRFSSSLSETLRKVSGSSAHGHSLSFDTKASSSTFTGSDDERLSPIRLSPPPQHQQNSRHQSAPLSPDSAPAPASANVHANANANANANSPASAPPRETRHDYGRRISRQFTFPATQSEAPLVLSPPAATTDATSSNSNLKRTKKTAKSNAYPPLSMNNRGHFFEPAELDLANSTTNWVKQMTALQDNSNSVEQGLAGDEQRPYPHPPPPPQQQQQQQQTPESKSQHRRLSLSRSQTEPVSRPKILPIRGFKGSSQRSTDMASRRSSSYYGEDATLRALEGFENAPVQSEQQSEHNSDESDLFLRAAREEELQAKSNMNNGNGHTRSNSVRTRAPSGSAFQQYPQSRFSQRASLPPPSSTTTSYQPSTSRRRGSDHDSSVNGMRPMDEQDGIGQALTYRPEGRDRPVVLEDSNRSRYNGNGVNTRSNPSTPRGSSAREFSPEQPSFGGRRPSIPEANLQQRSYRQSNLSYTTPRTYNSSPLVSRTTDMHEVPETPRAAEGTASTVSTTAPSTVWDELEDLKSRIHRLELTGKLPPTSGAAMSRASHDRPPTATTTVTTMSSSPKQRGRGNSISPVETSAEPTPPETHPLLHSALAKSKSLLDPEIYRTLEATAADALAISSMMGTSGQPGPISSSQSTAGGNASVSDRQVRRKADSMCRSLTELCLALSEGKLEAAPPVTTQVASRPGSRDTELYPSIETNNTPRQLVTTDLARIKSSPRALSRLEARRSSLLATSALPSPRFTPSEVGTPTQSTMAGRRTSLLLRSRRGGTEEPEEDDDTRFRAPSRATTEVGRLRSSPREHTSQQPLPERNLVQPVQSSLPVRRHYQSTSLNNTIPAPTPPLSSLGGRRFLDRTTPERDTTSLVGRLAEDRGQRKSSIGLGNLQIGRTGSLNRRSLQPRPNDADAGQQRPYQ
ncbi:hypothetical protein VTL71DRAFT_8160 [Oculimacula yallundae]|uniref:Uncharacterized protein n=1 Tax=Oculimacula yallundae TaxID=86028 RepID=A0ABR4CX19_9HELO